MDTEFVERMRNKLIERHVSRIQSELSWLKEYVGEIERNLDRQVWSPGVGADIARSGVQITRRFAALESANDMDLYYKAALTETDSDEHA